MWYSCLISYLNCRDTMRIVLCGLIEEAITVYKMMSFKLALAVKRNSIPSEF